jgi:Spy/CpxP family protein refolding chaperone
LVNRTKLTGVLVIVGVFLLGALAGGAGLFAWQQRSDADELMAGPTEWMQHRRLAALGRHLGLSSAQREQIRQIMLRHRAEREKLLNDLNDRCGTTLRDHKAKVDAEIRAVLSPEQQAQFDRLQAKQRERFPFGQPPMMGRGGMGRGGMGRGGMGRGGPPMH